MGRGGLRKPEAGELRVAHHAHDAEGAGILGQVQAEVLVERIFVALEEALSRKPC